MEELILNLLTIVRILSAAMIGAGGLMIVAHMASKILCTKPVEWLFWEGLEFGYKGTIIYTISLMVKFAAEHHGII